MSRPAGLPADIWRTRVVGTMRRAAPRRRYTDESSDQQATHPARRWRQPMDERRKKRSKKERKKAGPCFWPIYRAINCGPYHCGWSKLMELPNRVPMVHWSSARPPDCLTTYRADRIAFLWKSQIKFSPRILRTIPAEKISFPTH